MFFKKYFSDTCHLNWWICYMRNFNKLKNWCNILINIAIWGLSSSANPFLFLVTVTFNLHSSTFFRFFFPSEHDMWMYERASSVRYFQLRAHPWTLGVHRKDDKLRAAMTWSGCHRDGSSCFFFLKIHIASWRFLSPKSFWIL